MWTSIRDLNIRNRFTIIINNIIYNNRRCVSWHNFSQLIYYDPRKVGNSSCTIVRYRAISMTSVRASNRKINTAVHIIYIYMCKGIYALHHWHRILSAIMGIILLYYAHIYVRGKYYYYYNIGRTCWTLSVWVGLELHMTLRHISLYSCYRVVVNTCVDFKNEIYSEFDVLVGILCWCVCQIYPRGVMLGRDSKTNHP